jgi:hypothetical protein
MATLREIGTVFTHLGWKKVLGLAAFLVACDPFVPTTGYCGDLPACSSLDYAFQVKSSNDYIMPDSVTGAYPIESLGFRLDVQEIFDTVAIACHGSPRSGIAYASSCFPCQGKYFMVDSLYFTTDILLYTGDTLRAGYNLAKGSDPVGISVGGRSVTLRSAFPTRFRNSIFEVRFAGYADTVQKTGSITLHITNPALLIP